MPASLLELKKRIASVKQTSKITEAMHMVSAAKLNQTEKKETRATRNITGCCTKPCPG